jgi:Uma2 family endonuclease
MSTAVLEPPVQTPRPAAIRGPRLLTAADLAMLPTSLSSGDVRYELDDGRLIIMPPPGDIHGRRQAKIVRFLDSEAEERGLGEVRAEVGIVLRRNPDRVVGADAAFILATSLPVRRSKEGYLETIPEIVVEVRSKNDTSNEVRAKKEEYFDAGVKLVWVLDSDDRTIAAHEPGKPVKLFAVSDTLATELLPGFVVPVAKLFV